MRFHGIFNITSSWVNGLENLIPQKHLGLAFELKGSECFCSLVLPKIGALDFTYYAAMHVIKFCLHGLGLTWN
jgi:hypothetical protein